MVVNPKKLTYVDHMAQLSLQISNSGNNDLLFSEDNLPEAFLAEPKAAALPRGTTASVIIYRLAFPIAPSKPITFHMRSNFQDDIPVELEVDSENAALYDKFGR